MQIRKAIASAFITCFLYIILIATMFAVSFVMATRSNLATDTQVDTLLLMVNLATDTQVDTLFYNICLREIDLKPHIFIQ